MERVLSRRACAALLASTATTAFAAPIDVVTERYDAARLGANLDETVLTTSNVGVATFGKLWAYPVSGSVYAQPLYVRNVAIPGQGVHDLVYVVTMNDRVYAFDAHGATTTPLLSLDITSQVPGATPIPILDILGYNDNIIGNVGIESTPQIDLATNTMYLVARTRETGSNCGPVQPTFCQRLHALDITTLAELPGSPVVLGGSVPGNGNGSAGGVLTFNPKIQDQRASIALANGRVFIAWGAHSDQFAYHGWVMVHDASTLQRTAIWTSTPDGTAFNGGGIWMAGRAPAVDADGNVYYMVGNGTYDGVRNFGESFVKFGATPDTPMLDWFTPSVYDELNQADADLGGSGPILLPGTDRIVGAGKSGVFYVTRTTSLGHESADDANIVQVFSNGGQQIKGGPVYWNRSGGAGPWMYVWSDGNSPMKAYRFDASAGTFDTTPASQSTLFSNNGSAGGVLTLSANGSTPGTGVLWSSMAFSGSDPNSGVHPGVLRALDADDLTHELWNSEQDAARDRMGNWPKFSPPTVVGGRVYMASFPGDGVGAATVSTYGLLPTPDFALAATPRNPGVHPGDSVVYTIDTSALQGYSGMLHFDVAGLPPDATASFAANDIVAGGSTTLTVQTAASMPPGPNTFEVTATDGTLSHSEDIGLHASDVDAGAGTISVDFVGTGTPMDARERAGAVAAVNWNSFAGSSGSAAGLVDETGSATAASIQWSAAGVWRPSIPDTAGDFRMMDGYLSATDTPVVVSVSGLADDPSGYYVHVYADGDNPRGASTASCTIAASGDTPRTIDVVDATGIDFAGDYLPAGAGPGNHAVFFVAGNAFTLTVAATASLGTLPRAALNGLQIVHGDRIYGDGFEHAPVRR
ncbi:PQQ-binding-like beta-propeller repeat protein [Dokdonella sp.]|uniref:COG1470 family protein n=1 Tax=Dokdonella sp. TaxID=2291710 RepID=UPI002F3FCF10